MMTDNPERYEIWERRMHGIVSPRLVEAVVVATCPSPEAVGTAIITQAQDRWDAEDFSAPPVTAVLDTETGRWVTGLWA